MKYDDDDNDEMLHTLMWKTDAKRPKKYAVFLLSDKELRGQLTIFFLLLRYRRFDAKRQKEICSLRKV